MTSPGGLQGCKAGDQHCVPFIFFLFSLYLEVCTELHIIIHLLYDTLNKQSINSKFKKTPGLIGRKHEGDKRTAVQDIYCSSKVYRNPELKLSTFE